MLVVMRVHDENALRDVYLRRGKADARRGVHRFEHVVDQLLEKRVGDIARIDFFGNFPQARMAVGNDLANVGHRRCYSTVLTRASLAGALVPDLACYDQADQAGA